MPPDHSAWRLLPSGRPFDPLFAAPAYQRGIRPVGLCLVNLLLPSPAIRFNVAQI